MQLYIEASRGERPFAPRYLNDDCNRSRSDYLLITGKVGYCDRLNSFLQEPELLSRTATGFHLVRIVSKLRE
jgi:hypothetical protein